MNNHSAAAPILRVDNVCKTVATAEGQLSILDSVSLEINAGESVAVVGASGSGKTTLLGILAGLDLPTAGDVWLDGDRITAMPEEDRARVRGRCVGFVFQTFQLIESLTALENVMLPSELRGESDAGDDARMYLDRVGLADRLTHYPRQLSGGEQQRVAVARALVKQPAVLFADEPTGELDQGSGATVLQLLRSAVEERRMTAVVTSHDHLATGYADLVYAIADGMLHRVEPAADGTS